MAAGGGLLICDYGMGYSWWWGGYGSMLSNKLLREAGIGYTEQGYRSYAGNTPPGVMHVGTDVVAATAGTQPVLAADILRVLTGSDGVAHTGAEVAAAEAARDVVMPVLQKDDHLYRRLAATTCAAAEVYDAASDACVPGNSCPGGTYPAATPAACVACHATCGTCDGPTGSDCVSCDTTTAFVTLDSGACKPCAVDEFNAAGTCVACHGTCATCTAAAADDCTSCPTGLALTDGGRCEAQCAAAPTPPNPVPSVFMFHDGTGAPVLVTSDCTASSPFLAVCNDAATQTVTGGGTTYYVVGPYDPAGGNLMAECV